MEDQKTDSPPAADAKEKGVSRGGLALLGVGAALLAGVVGWNALKDGGEEPAPVVAAEGAPLTLEQLRERAEADPLNSEAWTELGFALSDTGDFAGAARAYRQAIEGDKDNAALWSALGEMRIYAEESNPMPPGALMAFQKAFELDPTDYRARYFLAVQKDLTGDHEGAIADWLALLEDTPAGAPWDENLQRTIEQSGKKYGIETASRIAKATSARPEAPQLTAGNAIPGPSQQDLEGASAIPPGEQRDMAVGMVESLEGKLRANPKNPDGWVMLMRSRMTLGEPDKARKALADAVKANPANADRLKDEAAALGVPGT
ncbi:tetratricopeptide repeat protein [Parerythrobacter lacustris]|uniref:Tetratricopeptide repeat protein n=1 Tax=Parerythrobacter lacustris TaxID=2969984 RepID=A0ABT1XMD6_9SPHN|nr:tetratricopeptide repeat protein [Parerythrobacter lacustris]MCR2832824.1 tetratricopeptide repeat protein [Parerythrobacter lacustris]